MNPIAVRFPDAVWVPPTIVPLTTREVATLLWWTTREVAAAWGVTDAEVRLRIANGTLPARPSSTGYRVHEDDVRKGAVR